MEQQIDRSDLPPSTCGVKFALPSEFLALRISTRGNDAADAEMQRAN